MSVCSPRRHHPTRGLICNLGDGFKVVVIVQQSQAVLLGRGRKQEIWNRSRSVFTSAGKLVLYLRRSLPTPFRNRHPREASPEASQPCLIVGKIAGREENLKLGNRADVNSAALNQRGQNGGNLGFAEPMQSTRIDKIFHDQAALRT